MKNTMDINTVEGWCKCCEIVNSKAFTSSFGRNHRNNGEFPEWVSTVVKTALAESDAKPKKYGEIPRFYDCQLGKVERLWEAENDDN